MNNKLKLWSKIATGVLLFSIAFALILPTTAAYAWDEGVHKSISCESVTVTASPETLFENRKFGVYLTKWEPETIAGTGNFSWGLLQTHMSGTVTITWEKYTRANLFDPWQDAHQSHSENSNWSANRPGNCQITYCHVAGLASDPANYITLTTSINAASGHFDENGTPLAGHENDSLGACNPPERQNTATLSQGNTCSSYYATAVASEGATITGNVSGSWTDPHTLESVPGGSVVVTWTSGTPLSITLPFGQINEPEDCNPTNSFSITKHAPTCDGWSYEVSTSEGATVTATLNGSPVGTSGNWSTGNHVEIDIEITWPTGLPASHSETLTFDKDPNCDRPANQWAKSSGTPSCTEFSFLASANNDGVITATANGLPMSGNVGTFADFGSPVEVVITVTWSEGTPLTDSQTYNFSIPEDCNTTPQQNHLTSSAGSPSCEEGWSVNASADNEGSISYTVNGNPGGSSGDWSGGTHVEVVVTATWSEGTPLTDSATYTFDKPEDCTPVTYEITFDPGVTCTGFNFGITNAPEGAVVTYSPASGAGDWEDYSDSVDYEVTVTLNGNTIFQEQGTLTKPELDANGNCILEPKVLWKGCTVKCGGPQQEEYLEKTLTILDYNDEGCMFWCAYRSLIVSWNSDAVFNYGDIPLEDYLNSMNDDTHKYEDDSGIFYNAPNEHGTVTEEGRGTVEYWVNHYGRFESWAMENKDGSFHNWDMPQSASKNLVLWTHDTNGNLVRFRDVYGKGSVKEYFTCSIWPGPWQQGPDGTYYVVSGQNSSDFIYKFLLDGLFPKVEEGKTWNFSGAVQFVNSFWLDENGDPKPIKTIVIPLP